MDYVGQRTVKLYHRLKKERNADNWQMGVGLVLFFPTLFFLEGGDGPEAAEYAQLKGEFEALRENSVKRKCEIEALSPEEVLKREESEAKKKDEAETEQTSSDSNSNSESNSESESESESDD